MTFLPQANHGQPVSPGRVAGRIGRVLAVAVAFYAVSLQPSWAATGNCASTTQGDFLRNNLGSNGLPTLLVGKTATGSTTSPAPDSWSEFHNTSTTFTDAPKGKTGTWSTSTGVGNGPDTITYDYGGIYTYTYKVTTTVPGGALGGVGTYFFCMVSNTAGTGLYTYTITIN